MSKSKLSLYQTVIHQSKYARYLWDEKRRETWDETCSRYSQFCQKHWSLPDEEEQMLFKAVNNLEALPSMRLLMTAGPAVEKAQFASFNCSALPIDSIRAFDEILYILCCGTGVGYSIEKRFVDQLPEVSPYQHDDKAEIVVPDSRKGWAGAFKRWLKLLWEGITPTYDVSRIRPKGAPLKTFGGKASGPEPLVDLLEFSKRIIQGARGRKLTTLECHDIVCKIAEIVVAGAVRRSALICLGDLDDVSIRDCKTGLWQVDQNGIWSCTQPQRQLANNSAVYESKPSVLRFMEEWAGLVRSQSGERGIFNREGARKQALKWGREDAFDQVYMCNPCTEIILRPKQCCNLSTVPVRPKDTLKILLKKVEIAAIMGTLQSDLTDFDYVRSIWKRNCDEERLLGVALTGIYDHEVLSAPEHAEKRKKWLNALRQKVIDTNKEWADRLGIQPSKSVTTIKPSGTSGELTDTASGIHPRHASHYIRRVRVSSTDPTLPALREAGVRMEACQRDPEGTTILAFPRKAPEGAMTSSQLDPIDHMELIREYCQEYCTHTVSATVSVRDHDWLRVGSWVYDNFDDIIGLSFLPYFDSVNDEGAPKYPQMPYEPISAEKYEEMSSQLADSINWDLVEEEEEDNTTAGKTMV